jgi:hypothetical protein
MSLDQGTAAQLQQSDIGKRNRTVLESRPPMITAIQQAVIVANSLLSRNLFPLREVPSLKKFSAFLDVEKARES